MLYKFGCIKADTPNVVAVLSVTEVSTGSNFRPNYTERCHPNRCQTYTREKKYFQNAQFWRVRALNFPVIKVKAK